MAMISGVDPNSRLTGATAWQNLQGAFGQPLTDQHKQQAMGLIGYSDPTGAQEIGGGDYNRLLEEGSKLFGHQFTPWQAPATQPQGPAPAAGQPQAAGPPQYPWNAPSPVTPGAGLQLPEAYTHEAFTPPTFDQYGQDPGYQFVNEQGLKGIQNSAAARGNVFTGGTMKSLADWAQRSAATHGRDVFDRALTTYNTNRDTATGVYDRAVDSGLLRDKAIRDDRLLNLGERGQSLGEHQYLSGEQRWQAQFAQQVAEFSSSDQFRRAVFGSDDEYRRFRATEEDAWKREVMAEERQRFLAQLGTL